MREGAELVSVSVDGLFKALYALRDYPAADKVLVALLEQLGDPQRSLRWEPAKVATFLGSMFEDEDFTVADLEEMRPALLNFFIELADGRWILNPDVASAVGKLS